ncbi:MAG: hypothetical protein ACRDYE_12725 [Acidimicrobiales bacterium]
MTLGCRGRVVIAAVDYREAEHPLAEHLLVGGPAAAGRPWK